MKNLLAVTIISFIPCIVVSQELLPVKDGKIMYERIDSIPGKSKIDLYRKAKVWFAKVFHSSKDVIQLDDQETGQIIGKGNFTYPIKILLSAAEWRCSFTIQIDLKDNKSRVRLFDLSYSSPGGEWNVDYLNKHPGQGKQHIKAINEHCKSLMADFNLALNKKEDDF